MGYMFMGGFLVAVGVILGAAIIITTQPKEESDD